MSPIDLMVPRPDEDEADGTDYAVVIVEDENDPNESNESQFPGCGPQPEGELI